MTRVFVADSDESLASAMRRSLAHFGIQAVACSSPSEARAHLEEQRFALLVLDHRVIRAGGHGGAGMNENVPIVFTASFVGPLEGPSLVQGFTLLRKPFSSLELLSIVRSELGQPGVQPASTIDALRRAHAGKCSLCLSIRSERTSPQRTDCRVYVEDGEVVHAVSGTLEGVAALKEILRRRGPVERQSSDVTAARSIRSPFKQLVFEILQELDTPLAVRSQAFRGRSTGSETVEN
jgi:CheY-like chemotaxis protein